MSAAVHQIVGCMTSASGDVEERLTGMRGYSRFAKDLAGYIKCITFRLAGYSQRRGDEAPGQRGYFVLSDAVAMTNGSKAEVCRARARLMADNIIRYDPDPDRPGCGWVEWNLDFDTWLPLQADYPRWGGRRGQSGNQTGVDNLPMSAEHTSVDNLPAHNAASCKRPPATDGVKLSKPASHKAANEAAPAAGLRISQREETEREEVPAAAGGDHSARTPTREPAPAPAPSSASKQEQEIAGVIAELRAAPDWRADDSRDRNAVVQLARSGYELEWLREEANSYSLYETDKRHTALGFKHWCSSEVAQNRYRQWQSRQRARAAERAAAEMQRVTGATIPSWEQQRKAEAPLHLRVRQQMLERSAQLDQAWAQRRQQQQRLGQRQGRGLGQGTAVSAR